MSSYHEHAIAILTTEVVEMERACADVRTNIPDWEDSETLGRWMQETEWKAFDLKRSLNLLRKDAEV